MSASYETSESPSGVVFKVVPAQPPFPIGAAIWFGLLALFGSMMFSNVAFAILLFLTAAYIVYIARYNPKAMRYRKPASFFVSNEGVMVDDSKTAIAPDAIHRLVLRNHYSGSEYAYVPSPGMLVGGTGIAGVGAAAVASTAASVMQIGGHLGNADRRRVAKLCYRLELEARGKAVPLAGGLDETTAYGLMTEVGNAIDRIGSFKEA